MDSNESLFFDAKRSVHAMTAIVLHVDDLVASKYRVFWSYVVIISLSSRS